MKVTAAYYGDNLDLLRDAILDASKVEKVVPISNVETFDTQIENNRKISLFILEISDNSKSEIEFIENLRASNYFNAASIVAIINNADVKSLDDIYTAGINWHMFSDFSEGSYQQLTENINSLLSRLKSTNQDI